MSVPGGFFEVTGREHELREICAGIERNGGRESASESNSLDLWQEMLEEWFRIHDAKVIEAALRAEIAKKQEAYDLAAREQIRANQAEALLREVMAEGWQYGVTRPSQPSAPCYFMRNQEEAERFIANPPLGTVNPRELTVILKRRKAGPWEPIA